MRAKQFINIIFLLIIIVTSLPVKRAGQFFYKKQVQQEMCDDCDMPLKKADDSLDFKDFPYCQHNQHYISAPTITLFSIALFHAKWQLPLWPAVDIHTPPPNTL